MKMLCILLALLQPAPCSSSWMFHMEQGEVKKEVIEPTPQNRCVLVTTSSSRGTGIILKNGLVLTNFHMLDVDSETYVWGKKVEKLTVFTAKDLTLLHIPTHDFPMLQFADPVIGETVTYYGNPFDQTCVAIQMTVISVMKGKVYFNGMILPGASGSGVWNKDGKLVGIVEGRQSANGWNGFGYAIPSSVIRGVL